MPKVTALVTGDTMSELYRVYAPFTYLRSEGFSWLQANKRNISSILASPTDILAFQRILMANARGEWVKGTEVAVNMLRQAKVKLVAEIDDDFTSLPLFNKAVRTHPQWPEAFRYSFEAADAVLTSTPFLAERLRSINPNVVYIKNRIDPAMWSVPKAPSDHVGVAGSKTHYMDWLLLPEIWDDVRKTFPDASFTFIGYKPDYIDFPHTVVPGTHYRSFPNILPAIGIGLAPLEPERLFCRSKSDCKFLEYSMAGVVTIAQNCIPYSETIVHGKTGFLASTPLEWSAYIKLLIADADLRATVAALARDYVLTQRNAEKQSHLWVDFYAGVQKGRIVQKDTL